MALVGFPLFICLWLTHQSFKYEGKQRFFLLLLSGFVGGIVLVFKFLFLLILLSFWVTLLIYSVLTKRHKIKKVFVEICLPIFIGIILPILSVVSYFAWFDSLSILYQTFFLYPPQIIANFVFNKSNLISGIKWFLQSFSPLLLLGILTIDVSMRKGKSLLTLLLFLWCISGLRGLVLTAGGKASSGVVGSSRCDEVRIITRDSEVFFGFSGK